ncbi:protein of unknown function [Taphrina deformans PYCC 5710]|uniref:Uncharacterized protein n=1 Tax=Taphrina deformans (strain PYCC 5710 / ATCC 11124 / CBS 356.35 / IMI 108563 / JCM 9778 / NBRC 8474) TaxID=1097556 RepID=R4XAT1_TAPDE|nr:protein of unknown function [Taphrina deformans PYCC 5710]|eukprot:CCG82639.1 protein of unknown function [Taphrina deformans PYCC 5710]
MLFSPLLTLAVMIATATAKTPQPHHLRRYANETASMSSFVNGNMATDMVGSVVLAAIENLSPSTSALAAQTTTQFTQDPMPTSLRTITLRTTVTLTPSSTRTTPYPSSALFDPQVAVVAAAKAEAPIVPAASPVVTLKTVYLPTTIYVTNPCAATQSTVTQNQAPPAQSSVPAQSTDAAAPAVAGNVQGASVDAAAAQAAVTNVPFSLARTSTPDPTSYATVHVTQTLHSTVTVHALALATAQAMGPSLVQSGMAPYGNTTTTPI